MYLEKTPKEMREIIRTGEFSIPTAGYCKGYAQGNLVVLPKEYAYDFLLFCQRNEKSCPLLEVSDVSSRTFLKFANGCDIAKDIPKYRIYEKGVLTGEYTDVEQFWRADLVSFLIGCSFSFEDGLIKAGIPVRHIDLNCNVPMYQTNIPCESAGIFHGNMVVSMRPIKENQVVRSVLVTQAMHKVHGAPIHIGDPKSIGIKDLDSPDFGDPVPIYEDEVPVFWPCGVTPQAAIMSAKPSFAITHAPGHMMITDILNDNLSK